ncbi:MAG: lipid A biosynthesis acyltransferase [Pseudomonadota bacterium]
MSERPWTRRAAKWVRHTLALMLVRALQGRAWVLPDAAVLALGRGLGWLARSLLGSTRRQVEAQLRERLGVDADQARELGRQVFRHFGESGGEWLLMARWRRRFDTVVEARDEDLAAFAADYAAGRGLIFITGHIGNWELMAQYMAYRGFRVASVARPTFDPRLTELLKRWRLSGGMRTLNRGDPSTVREMLGMFKRGEALGILVDVDTSVPSLWVPFFGQLAKTPRTAADLALRTRAPVWFGYAHRTAPGRHRLHIERVPVDSTGQREVDALCLTADLTARIERAVRARPEQWVWMHRRWRNPPPAEVPPEKETGTA